MRHRSARRSLCRTLLDNLRERGFLREQPSYRNDGALAALNQAPEGPPESSPERYMAGSPERGTCVTGNSHLCHQKQALVSFTFDLPFARRTSLTCRPMSPYSVRSPTLLFQRLHIVRQAQRSPAALHSPRSGRHSIAPSFTTAQFAARANAVRRTGNDEPIV